MSDLLNFIAGQIQKNGPLSVTDYMRIALQHPEFGYYRHGDPLGQGGDFITAPEISQMFGEMIGLWCADVWQQMGKPAAFTLLELGPGHGTLMQDALRATAKISGFHQALSLYLLESSATLRSMQMEKLAQFQPHYISGFEDLPQQPLIAVANEFFDAMPIRQFEKTFAGWCERLVTMVDGQLTFTLSAPDPAVELLIPQTMRGRNPGAVAELSPVSVNMVRDLARLVVHHGGAALLIDYGYAEPDGLPTLQAVADHRFAEVLDNPGQADLTALVDFGLLRRAAETQDAVLYGPIGQGDFLNDLGIGVRADQLKRQANAEQTAAIDAARHRLTDAAEMGSLFKVMAMVAPSLAVPPGF